MRTTDLGNLLTLLTAVVCFLFLGTGMCGAQEEIGQLRINTVPPGATLYRDDGIIEGLTPQEMILIEAGVHDIELVLEGYEPMKRKIRVWPGVVTDYTFKLQTLQGMICCPHCGKHFKDPTPAPNRWERGPLFKELNFLVYKALGELMPMDTGMLGFAAVLNNPAAVGFGDDNTGPQVMKTLPAGIISDDYLTRDHRQNVIDRRDQPIPMTDEQRQENQDYQGGVGAFQSEAAGQSAD